MYAVIRAKLKSDVGEKTLEELARETAPHSSGLPTNGAQAIHLYNKQHARMAVHICEPSTGAYALFLWQGDRHFQIIIDTVHRGNLRVAAEYLISSLQEKMKRRSVIATLSVELKSFSDDHVYVTGQPFSILSALWQVTNIEVSSLIVAAMLIGITTKWLQSYHEEAIAVTIGLTLSLLIKAGLTLFVNPQPAVVWNTNEAP